MLKWMIFYCPAITVICTCLGCDQDESYFRNMYNDGHISISPDCKYIYCSSDVKGESVIYRIDTTNDNPPEADILTKHDKYSYSPIVSASSKYLAYVEADKGHSIIWLADRDGLNAFQLTHGSRISQISEISKDDSKLIFIESLAEGGLGVTTYYNVVDIDSRERIYGPTKSEVIFLGNDNNLLLTTYDEGGVSADISKYNIESGKTVHVTKGVLTAASPDGSLICYAKDWAYDNGYEFMVTDFALKEICRIKSPARPSFNSANNELYYIKNKSGRVELHVKDLENGAEHMIYHSNNMIDSIRSSGCGMCFLLRDDDIPSIGYCNNNRNVIIIDSDIFGGGKYSEQR